MEDSHEQLPSASGGRRKFWLTVLILIFLLAGFLYLLYWLLIAQFRESTDDAYVIGNQVQVMPQVSGLVTAILTQETDLVQKGQPLVGLDRVDAEINLETNQAQLALTVRQTRQLFIQVAELQANVQIKQATLERAEEDLQRRSQLAKTNVVSVETLRHAQIEVDAAKADLELAKQQLAAATAQVSNTDVAHHPQVELAAVRLKNAYLALARTTIFAPENGYIATRNVQVGQEVTPANVLMIIVPLSQVWVNANFKETQLRNIRLGQPVKLISDAYGSHVIYHGKVEGFSAGTGSAFDILPPQNATGNWIKIVQRLPVKIALDPQEIAKYPLRIGLSMRVVVNTFNRKGPLLKQPTKKPRALYETQNFNNQLQPANRMIRQIIKGNS